MNGIDYTFLAQATNGGEVKKPTGGAQQIHQTKPKNSKSNDKYVGKPSTQGSIQPRQRGDKEAKSNVTANRYESISSKIKSKRRFQQPSNLNLKENVYSPSIKQNPNHYDQVLNQTIASNAYGSSKGEKESSSKNITLGLSDRHHIDLSQTQNINSQKLGHTSSQIKNNNNTIKTSSGEINQGNFDFGCQLRLPASTKHSTSKQAIQNSQTSDAQQMKNSFFTNQNLQDFMTNMNNMTQNFQKPFFQQNMSNNNGANSQSNHGSVKRKQSNQSSNNNIVIPVLDMKKVSVKQIQNIMKQKAISIRENSNDENTQRKIKQKQQNQQNNEHHPQNQLTNIADSNLYKNLTQKLIQEQQMQQQSSIGNQNVVVAQSKFNLFKKQGSYNKGMNQSLINQPVNNNNSHLSIPQDQQKRFFSNTKNSQNQQQNQQVQNQNNYSNHQQNIPITATNKTQKSFNFDLSNQQPFRKAGIKNAYNSNQVGSNPKKKLNLTGTFTKGLLSPTNNGTNKHKHSEYFESANNANTFDKDENLRSKNIAGQKNQQQQPLNTIINIQQAQFNQYNDLSQVYLSGLSQVLPNQQQQNFMHPNTKHQYESSHFDNQSDTDIQVQYQKYQTQKLKIPSTDSSQQNQFNQSKLNQTTKIDRTDALSNNSISPIQVDLKQNFYLQSHHIQPQANNYLSNIHQQPQLVTTKSQVFTSNSNTQQQTQNKKRGSHHKTSTLPNAAVLLELISANPNNNIHSDVNLGHSQFKSNYSNKEQQINHQKAIQSVGQTPRHDKTGKLHNNASIVMVPKQKLLSNNKNNKRKGSQGYQQQQDIKQFKQNIQIQIDQSDDENVPDLQGVNINNQQADETPDFNEFSFKNNKATMESYDYLSNELAMDIQNKQNMKLRTQKFSDLAKIINQDTITGDYQSQSQPKHDHTIILQQLEQITHPYQYNQKQKQHIASPVLLSSNHNLQFTSHTSTQNQSQKLQLQTNSTNYVTNTRQRKNSHTSQGSNKASAKNSARKSPKQVNQQILPQQVEINLLQFPITPAKALKLFINQLTDYEKGEILDYKQVYYLGIGAKKIKGSPLQQYNSGYDDERGDYKVVLQDHIGYRWEVIEFLGKGSFGQALKCFDHKTQEIVAVKLIRNKKRFQHQAGVELKILQHLKDNDPDDSYNIIRIKDYLFFRKHLVISFELFSINLYEFIKNNNFQGVSLSLIRRFAIQMLQALKYLKEEQVIHCDLKPENILLKSPDKSGIKIIDFGSSCFSDERIYTYIQSRFYRAPEIVLGIPYTSAIDMWSFGCILVELFTGYPIFPGESEQEQLALIMEIRGVPPSKVLDQSTRKKLFFDEETDEPILVQNSRGKVRIPNSKTLQGVLRCQSSSFLDFIERCLDWNPQTRITPIEALMHEWIIEGLPPKVLLHHQRMLGLNVDEDDEEDPNNQRRRPKMQTQHIRYQKSQPPQSTKAGNQISKLSKTCLINEAYMEGPQQDGNNGFGNLSKRGKSLNKTGMIVIDENEDMADIDSYFFQSKKKSITTKNQNIKNLPQKKKLQLDIEDTIDEQEKSKTTNLADILHEIKNNKKKEQGVINKKDQMKLLENTHDISKLKKNSFFSQNNYEDQIFQFQDDSDSENNESNSNGDYGQNPDNEHSQILPYDEREQGQDNGHNNHKKNKIPFSFLMHHYLKTNTGQQIAAQDPTVGFFKPQGKDIKLNNFMGAAGNQNVKGNNNGKKGFINLSSNV